MGQNHSDMLCEDIFGGYIKYVHYKERHKCLLINKRTYNLYNNAYFEKDKKIFMQLKDILNNPQFFSVLLSDTYEDYIKKQNEHIVSALHEFTFTKRNFALYREYGFNLIVLPLRIVLCCIDVDDASPVNITEFCNKAPINILSILDVDTKYLYQKISPLELFRDSIFNRNVNRVFIQNEEYKSDIGDISYPQYLNDYTDDHCLYFMDRGGWHISDYDSDKHAKKLHWNLFMEAMKDPIIVETLKILKEYDSFV
jgi:hypothetical protein